MPRRIVSLLGIPVLIVLAAISPKTAKAQVNFCASNLGTWTAGVAGFTANTHITLLSSFGNVTVDTANRSIGAQLDKEDESSYSGSTLALITNTGGSPASPEGWSLLIVADGYCDNGQCASSINVDSADTGMGLAQAINMPYVPTYTVNATYMPPVSLSPGREWDATGTCQGSCNPS